MSATNDEPAAIGRAILATAKNAELRRFYAGSIHRRDDAGYRPTHGRVIFSAALTGLPILLLRPPAPERVSRVPGP